MSDTKTNAKKYFDFMREAKKGFRMILEIHPELETLTAKEMEVFELLLTDKIVAEIAQELFVSASSIHFHCKNIYKKLNVSNRKQLYITYKDLY